MACLSQQGGTLRDRYAQGWHRPVKNRVCRTSPAFLLHCGAVAAQVASSLPELRTPKPQLLNLKGSLEFLIQLKVLVSVSTLNSGFILYVPSQAPCWDPVLYWSPASQPAESLGMGDCVEKVKKGTSFGWTGGSRARRRELVKVGKWESKG